MHSITRSQLVELAERTLAHVGVTSGDLRLDVLNVAHTATVIHRDWWEYDEHCGCLIGTLRHRRGEYATPPRCDIEFRIGIEFARELDCLFPGSSYVTTAMIVEDEPVPVNEPDRELAAV